MRGQDQRPDAPAVEGDIVISKRLLTIPNVLCLIRLAGSVLLVPVAMAGEKEWFLWLFIFLSVTDWLDGKLARWLDQRTVIGARLDSWADAALYAALVFGLVWLYGASLRALIPWIVAALLSYGISTLAGLFRYRRWPSYHTRAAKTSWFLTLVAVVCLFLDWSLIPAYIAVVAVILTNLEALLITSISPVWRADVTSVFHTWKQRD